MQAKANTGTGEGCIDARALKKLEPLRRLAGRNSTKADIVVYRYEGVDVAVKDYAGRPFLVRQTIGRLLTRRECRAYEALRGIQGLPEFLGRVGPYTMATRWADAKPLSELPSESVDRGVFDRVAEILQAVHARGVALADLHHRDVLVADDGTVTLVDLATAFWRGDRPGPISRRIFTRLCGQDRLALERLRARFTGLDPDQTVEALEPEAAAWHRRGRRLKRWLDFLRRRRR